MHDGGGSGQRSGRDPNEFQLTPEAAGVWNELTRLEQIRVELAVGRVLLIALRRRGEGPFITAVDGIAIEGEIRDGSRNVVVRALRRSPER